MEKVIRFVDIEIQKQTFHLLKEPLGIKNIDINKLVVSNKVPFGKKGFQLFIWYKDAKKIRPSCIFLLKMTAHYEKLLEKYNKFG